jgi:hypothetical protein
MDEHTVDNINCESLKSINSKYTNLIEAKNSQLRCQLNMIKHINNKNNKLQSIFETQRKEIESLKNEKQNHEIVKDSDKTEHLNKVAMLENTIQDMKQKLQDERTQNILSVIINKCSTEKLIDEYEAELENRKDKIDDLKHIVAELKIQQSEFTNQDPKNPDMISTKVHETVLNNLKEKYVNEIYDMQIKYDIALDNVSEFYNVLKFNKSEDYKKKQTFYKQLNEGEETKKSNIKKRLTCINKPGKMKNSTFSFNTKLIKLITHSNNKKKTKKKKQNIY